MRDCQGMTLEVGDTVLIHPDKENQPSSTFDTPAKVINFQWNDIVILWKKGDAVERVRWYWDCKKVTHV